MNDAPDTPKEPTDLQAALGGLIGALLKSSRDELLATKREDLRERYFHFEWNQNATLAYNIYKFSGALEAFKRICRDWEEHHGGNLCVVERVRDEHILPAITDAYLKATGADAKNNKAEIALFDRGVMDGAVADLLTALTCGENMHKQYYIERALRKIVTDAWVDDAFAKFQWVKAGPEYDLDRRAEAKDG
ncbi:MAG: hypothetical protein E6R03_11670 [Hyphomicrobiaceae bacterium]|nr:MAG: hypothetical protein E6R03_11670 [Hyphomicrobiaceae bacterium]